MQDEKSPLIEHLEELRKRLLICIIALITCGIISYFYIDKILLLFTKFLDKLIFIAPQEAFVTYIKISLFSGILLASPFIIFQIWRFIEKALTKIERRHFLVYVIASFFLFIGGVAFCYYIILPWALRFFLGFQTEKIIPMITLANFTTFCVTLLLSFGVLFELPVAIVFLSQVGLISPLFLRKQRKYVILAIFILSALLTPPDAITQILLALPLIGLYEISILLSGLMQRRRELKG